MDCYLISCEFKVFSFFFIVTVVFRPHLLTALINPLLRIEKGCVYCAISLILLYLVAVLFGEQHHQPSILKAQLCVLERMVSQSIEQSHGAFPVTVVLEMFNLQQQPLLDAYQANEISLEELRSEYNGTEGFSMEHYGYILEVSKSLGAKLVAGFVPKPFCRMIVEEGKTRALEKIEQTGGPPREFYVDGSEDHYRYFQGLISGNLDQVVDKYRRIFPAQVLRDSSFAYTIMDIVQKSEGHTRILGICGSGHLDFKYGIPERISPEIPTYVLTSRTLDDPVEHNVADCIYQYSY